MKRAGERWEQISRVFDAARQLPADVRATFLDETCPDPEVRREVASLLRAHQALADDAGRDFLHRLDPERASALLSSAQTGAMDPDDLHAGQLLGRYRIVRRMGQGGMGVVYLARDPRLGRPVALKLLPRHMDLDPAARERFEREARAASSLDHPNIATIYEVGAGPDGRLFIAMAFYDGETLRQKLKRGPLPVDTTRALAVQIAEGLAAAHRQGIVHRDVKPGNVFVSESGLVKILDFGIARIAGAELTRTGATPGTVAYMSPEQTRSDVPEPGSDVWALGVTLYEMLAGRRPFRAQGEQALIFAIRNDHPKPLSEVRSGIPPELARIVERCLRKDPAHRYQNAGELLADLRSVGKEPVAATGSRVRVGHVSVAGLAVLLLVGSLGLWSRVESEDARADPRPHVLATPRPAPAAVGDPIAVLPLLNQSPDPDDAYLADALTGELIGRLARVPGLSVIQRTSVVSGFGPGSPGGDAAEAGRALGAGAILSGVLTKTTDRVRLSLHLERVGDRERLWSGEYNVAMGDLAAVQDEIAGELVALLGLDGAPAQPARGDGAGLERTEAYTEYLKGRFFLGKHDERSFAVARDHFQAALNLDPTFAQAWSGLSDAYDQLASLLGLPPGEAYPRARAAAERALALDPDLAGAHASLAAALATHYWDSEAAERHFRRALELDPSSARAAGAYAKYLRNQGRLDEAMVHARRAQELDPLSAAGHIEEGIIHYLAGRHDASIAKHRQLLAAAPEFTYALNGIALSYAQQGRYEDALEALERSSSHEDHVNTHAVRGVVYAMAGRQSDARRTLAILEELARDQPVSGFHTAAIQVTLGDHDRALELLEEGVRERAPYLRLLKVEPIFAPLRGDPRFTDLLRRVGLES
jgi:serine/threonine protein kinase/tetratricopeptide (TPR) repeat protein